MDNVWEEISYGYFKAFVVCLVYCFGNALVGWHPVGTGWGEAFYIFMETFANHITFPLKKNLH